MRTYLAIAIAVLIAVSAAQAQTGAVYSLNVVGFQKFQAQPGVRLVGTPFDGASPDVNDVVGPQLTGGTGLGDADQIIIYSPTGGYKTLYLRNESGPPSWYNKWIDTDIGDVANVGIVPGQSWWVRSKQSTTQTVVLVGDVVDDEAFTNGIVAGIQMLSYPYSTAKAIQDLNITSNAGAVAGTGLGDADQIVVYDPEDSYRTMYLRNNTGPPSWQNKWIDTTLGDVATNVVNPDGGFWYRHKGSGFDWVEIRPYTLDQ